MIVKTYSDNLSRVPDLKLSNQMISMLDQFTSPYGIKNLESRYIYVNMAAVSLFGLKSKSDVIGKLDIEIKSKLTEFDDSGLEFIRQDKKVTDSESKLATLEIHPAAVDYPYIVNKIPFYNDEDNCVGLCLFSRNLEVYSLNDFVKGHMPGSLLLNKPDNFFTERNCEVMFFRLQGLSNKETAARLNLSVRTVENYMQILYEKVNVNHFDDFMSFCVEKGYHRYLPKRFIHTNHLKF
ncbi:PAS and helix-turn-helix domain-containing protein [Sodalis sp. dw_96]|uniref:PAS and helix-turn-helix domain-containing protein n=1 Tax=Sodalis sp. dw_96 TaxID=2719794 RepID=UPI001BD2FEE7|nr:PAS and helix-turn-helix domain-containing protein [Sodalis sp. dw_96]